MTTHVLITAEHFRILCHGLKESFLPNPLTMIKKLDLSPQAVNAASFGTVGDDDYMEGFKQAIKDILPHD